MKYDTIINLYTVIKSFTQKMDGQKNLIGQNVGRLKNLMGQ